MTGPQLTINNLGYWIGGTAVGWLFATGHVALAISAILATVVMALIPVAYLGGIYFVDRVWPQRTS